MADRRLGVAYAVGDPRPSARDAPILCSTIIFGKVRLHFLIFPKPEAMVSRLRLSSRSLKPTRPFIGGEAQPRAAGYLRVRLPLRAFLHRGARADLYGGRAPRIYYIMCNPKWRADVPHR